MCKATDAIKRLNDTEQASLGQLSDGPIRDQMDPSHAVKLMGMGLIELSSGQLTRTSLGNRAARMLSSKGSAGRQSWYRSWHKIAH